MKFLVTLFWALAIGQVVAFLGTKLVGASYDPILAVIVSIGVGIGVFILERFAVEKVKNQY